MTKRLLAFLLLLGSAETTRVFCRKRGLKTAMLRCGLVGYFCNAGEARAWDQEMSGW